MQKDQGQSTTEAIKRLNWPVAPTVFVEGYRSRPTSDAPKKQDGLKAVRAVRLNVDGLPSQKISRLDASLFQDGAEGTLRHVAGMIGNSGIATGCRVKPDLVGACGLPAELEPQSL